MGNFIGKLLSFVRVVRNSANLSDVKIDIGGGEIHTPEYSQPSGTDSVPLPGDFPIAVAVSTRSGGLVVTGMVETDALQKAQPGDHRTYARDAASRAETVEFWLKADGTAVLSNANGTFTLSPDGTQSMQTAGGSFTLTPAGDIVGENDNGDFTLQSGGTMVINTATIDPSGNIVATSVSAPSIVANGKELAGHDHAINSGSSAPGPTAPNN